MGINKILNDILDILPDRKDKPIHKTLKQYVVTNPDSKLVYKNPDYHADKLNNISIKLEFLEKNLKTCLDNHLLRDLVRVIFDTPSDRKDFIKEVMLEALKESKNLEQAFFENIGNEIAAYKEYADKMEHKFIKHILKPSINISTVKIFEWQIGDQKFIHINPSLTKHEYAEIFKDPKIILGISETIANTKLTNAIVNYMKFASHADYKLDPAFIEKNNYHDEIISLIAEIKTESLGE